MNFCKCKKKICKYYYNTKFEERKNILNSLNFLNTWIVTLNNKKKVMNKNKKSEAVRIASVNSPLKMTASSVESA